ncbi:unnamed protein product [Angiostrongylus costaricensis]|uniref:NR LBD domain-containing protein n=1 Tax=Angiostrongylus costaricensis TaxID=334426 RepID=A0A0R3PZH8_ANGCS|nr:unnamed protein product [Angiostrongylus costaricensis]
MYKKKNVLKRKHYTINSDENFVLMLDIKQLLLEDHHRLISTLLLIDRTTSGGSGRSPLFLSFISLAKVIDELEILDGYRTEWQVQDSERRLLTWAIHWARKVASMENTMNNIDNVSFRSAVKTLQNCIPTFEMNDSDARSLSSDGEAAARALRDSVLSVLYRHCIDYGEQQKTAARLTKILLSLPQLHKLDVSLFFSHSASCSPSSSAMSS